MILCGELPVKSKQCRSEKDDVGFGAYRGPTADRTVVPALEASYVRSMGDTDAKDLRILPENTFTGALSLKARKGARSDELSIRGAAGSDDYKDRSVSAKIGLTF